MSLSDRIKASQARLVAMRDRLFDHLGSLDDTRITDAHLKFVDDLCEAIALEQERLDALMGDEHAMMDRAVVLLDRSHG